MLKSSSNSPGDDVGVSLVAHRRRVNRPVVVGQLSGLDRIVTDRGKAVAAWFP